MPAIMLYLLKFSISLSAAYLFYQVVLRPITFYAWNRFYLLAYSLLSCIIPFIDITPVLEQHAMMDNRIVQFIPTMGSLYIATGRGSHALTGPASWPVGDILQLLVFAGVVFMLVRLLLRVISFRNILKKAQWVSGTDVKLYQVDQPIVPFSFGKSIFINRQLHTENELADIIRHEFVHVRQKHSLDILWIEFLCIINWYNPFVWLMRTAIRQNLEFIADNKVLQAGVDRKQYQYLLLKATGNHHFSIASQFNFSSLKKRIAMMNKIKSAKMHLLKFLFVLPLIAILIMSFRNKMNDRTRKISERMIHLSGIVYDNTTKNPLTNVRMTESGTGIQTETDERGYYKLIIPMTGIEIQELRLKFSKDGYADNDRRLELRASNGRDWSAIGFFSLLKNNDPDQKINHAWFYTAKDRQGNTLVNPGYDYINDKFDHYFKRGVYDAGSTELNIFSIEDVHLDTIRVEQGTVLNARDAVSMPRDGDGKGVATTIIDRKRAVEKGVFSSDSMVLNTAQSQLEILNIVADTIAWSGEKKELFFKGKVVMNDITNNIEGRCNYATIGASQPYVLLDGKEMLLDKDYVNYTKTDYWVISLTPREASRKYGNKGRRGAVEIISVNNQGGNEPHP